MERFEWPTEILGRFLHFLALDGAQSSFQQLAHLTTNNHDLKRLSSHIPQPLVLTVAISGREIFLLPFLESTVTNVEIHWGDGVVDTLKNQRVESATHSYAADGDYTVRVFRAPGCDAATRALDHLGFSVYKGGNVKSWYKPLTSLKSLGNLGIRSLSHLFYQAFDFNLDLSKLRTSDIEDMSAMFFHATRFNSDIGDWDVSKVQNMEDMFRRTSAFNQDIGRWDVSRVSNMNGMFFLATGFNQPICGWDTSNVTDMANMFGRATAFNQPIGEWDVSNVANMGSMFAGAETFNQPLDKWDVRKVARRNYMFAGAWAFNQNLDTWELPPISEPSSDLDIFKDTPALLVRPSWLKK
jgi:surface protein